jgi:methylphosphotriester-DNA--protein-cysteine methyltransferase
MEYAEFDAPPALARHVQCVWRLRDDAPGDAAQTIYPDGRCELIVHLGTPMRRHTLDQGWETQAQCLFAAQIRSAIRLAAAGPVHCIGVRLQPAASHAIAGAAVAMLADRIVALDHVDAAFAAAFVDACTRCGGGDLEPLWQLLRRRLAAVAIDAQVQAAIEVLDAAHGDITGTELARRCRIGLRSLQMRFVERVGLTLKEYARIQRLAATLRRLDRDGEDLATVALDQGFSDQAHATRELKSLTGLTPARLRRALAAERDGDDTLRLAAAFVRGHAAR